MLPAGPPPTVVCMLSLEPAGTVSVVPAGGSHDVAAPVMVQPIAVSAPLSRSLMVIDATPPGATETAATKLFAVYALPVGTGTCALPSEPKLAPLPGADQDGKPIVPETI